MPTPSSNSATPSLSPTAQVRTSTSAVILAIVILNTLGIVLLFFKLDWDVRQISAEIGLVRDAVKMSLTHKSPDRPGQASPVVEATPLEDPVINEDEMMIFIEEPME